MPYFRLPFFLFTALFTAAMVYSMTCTAQPEATQVSQEPHHHKIFENEWVRVLDVHVSPGDTTLMHKHSTPSVFIVLSNTKSGSQVLVEPAKANFSDGNIWFEGFYGLPRIHRVWNSDTVEFHVIDMEIVSKNNRSDEPPGQFALPGALKSLTALTALFDEKPVRGYRATLSQRATLLIKNPKLPLMIIGLDDTGVLTVNGKPFVKKGDFLFIQPGEKLALANKGDADTRFAIFEFK